MSLRAHHATSRCVECVFVTVCCSALECVADVLSVFSLRCVAVRWSVLQMC